MMGFPVLLITIGYSVTFITTFFDMRFPYALYILAELLILIGLIIAWVRLIDDAKR